MTLAGQNPGNLRYDGTAWLGLDDPPQDEHGFCRFVTMQAGVRALAKNLLNYQLKHDLHTVEDIINRWAPPSENDTQKYIEDVCSWMHVRPDELLDLQVPATLQALTSCIGHQETGQILDASIIETGVGSALTA